MEDLLSFQKSTEKLLKTLTPPPPPCRAQKDKRKNDGPNPTTSPLSPPPPPPPPLQFKASTWTLVKSCSSPKRRHLWKWPCG